MTQITVQTTGMALMGRNRVAVELDPADYARVVENGLRPVMQVAFGELEIPAEWDLSYTFSPETLWRLVVWPLQGKWGWSVHDDWREMLVEASQVEDLKETPAEAMAAVNKRFSELREQGAI